MYRGGSAVALALADHSLDKDVFQLTSAVSPQGRISLAMRDNFVSNSMRIRFSSSRFGECDYEMLGTS